MHGEHLDPVPGDCQLGRRQTVLDFLGRVQIRQQARDRRRTRRSGCAFGVAGDHVGECVEMLGARPLRQRPPPGLRSRRPARGAPRRPGRAGNDRVTAQRDQFAGQRADALISRRRIRVGRARIADRVGQTCGCRRRDRRPSRSTRPWPPRARLSARPAPRARRHSAAISRPPSRHRGPVSTRIAAAPAVGSATSRSMATTSATSGMDNKPASPTTSTGNPAGAQGIRDGCGVGVAAHQHRGGGRADAVGRGLADNAHAGGRRSTRVRRAHREATRSGRCRAGRPGASAALAPRPTVAAPPPRWRWRRAGPAAGCASWSAAPGPARGCRRIGGSRW